MSKISSFKDLASLVTNSFKKGAPDPQLDLDSQQKDTSGRANDNPSPKDPTGEAGAKKTDPAPGQKGPLGTATNKPAPKAPSGTASLKQPEVTSLDEHFLNTHLM